MEENKTIEKFLLRIDSDTKAAIEKQAKTQNRSLNGHIIQLIQDSLKPSIEIELNRKPSRFQQKLDDYMNEQNKRKI